MSYQYDFKKTLQVQPRSRTSSEEISGLETPDTGAGSRTQDTATSNTGAGASRSGDSNVPGSDTDQAVLDANAGTVRVGVGVGGVRTTRGAGAGGVLGRNGFEIPGGLFPEEETRSDYAQLDSSLRDLYLTGSHGLTSLYPAILLTSPRTSKVIDLNSGLTSTPFIIDLNNTIKRTIESDVKNAIAQIGPTLQLSTTQYEQNLIVAKQYADLCLTASRSKDRLIELTSIINTSVVNGPNQSQAIVIGGKNYQFLKGLPDVLTFVDTLNEEFTSKDFTEGSTESINTKSLVQMFKLLYNQFLIGNLYLISPHQTYSSSRPSHIWGQIDKNITLALNDLIFLAMATISNFKNTDRLADLVRIVQRDLIMQDSKAQMNLFFGSATSSAQGSLAAAIGKFKDDYITPKTQRDFTDGYTDIEDFTAGLRTDGEARSIFVQNDGTKNFNVLDSVDGHDYLLYDELASEGNSVELNNLVNFSNRYSQFANKLRTYYQTIFRDDQTRHKCLSIIASNFISFFGSSITREEFTSKASGVRMGLLLAASKNDKIAKDLFEFIRSTDTNRIETANNLLKSCENAKSVSNTGTLEVERTNNSYTSDGGVGWEDIDESYLTNTTNFQGTSFGMFHAIAEQLEKELAEGKLGSDNETSESLKITRNGRAFVFYQLFLDILRRFYFNVEFDRDQIRLPNQDIIEPQIKVTYKPIQANAVKYAFERYSKTKTEIESEIVNIDNDSAIRGFAADVRAIYDNYIAAIKTKIDEQEQNCLDIINLLLAHSAQITQEVATLTSTINSIKNIVNTSSLSGKESIMNSIQAEQAFLKKNIIDRYSYPLRGAQYLPSALDHNVGQALNTKTAVLTLPILNDAPRDAITRKFMVAVGIPTGLIENLRYQNTLSTKEHLYRIDLVFKNLQITQKDEDEDTTGTFATVSKTFSTRIFINEGYQLGGGADVVSSTLTNYQQIYDSTKYKYIDDEGNYLDAIPSTLEIMLGDKKIIENHLLSHYSKLYLKTTTGITLDESEFDLVPQTRRYPDVEQDANYTTIADSISLRYPNTPEGQLNKDRVLRDLSRATSLSPEQHKISMMSAKTFERIHVIPIDINDIIDIFEINTDYVFRDDLAFISVVARIQLEDSQPPMILRQSPTRRSFTQATSDAAAAFKQTDFRAQGADVVGINKMIETSNKFGGIMRGRG